MALKLLILTSEFPPRRGGIGTYARDLAAGAAELGYEVTVAAPSYAGGNEAFDASLPYEVLRFPGGPHRMKQLPAKIAYIRSLARARPDFDLVHAADWPFFMPLALSSYRRSARCVVTFHGTDVNFMQHPKRAWPLRALRFWNGWADYVANSNYTAETLARGFRLPTGAARGIGLGVSKAWLDGRVDREPARLARGFGEGEFVIASLGRVVPRKGHLVLAEALKRLPEEIARKVHWVIIGPPVDETYAAKVAEVAATLPGKTSIMGSIEQPDVFEILSGADLFCLPGHASADGAVEGFGLVYLEAAALGLTSVAGRLGGVPDAIIDGVTGILTPPDDVGATAEAIERLYLDAPLRERLSAAALTHARRTGWADVARQTYRDASVSA